MQQNKIITNLPFYVGKSYTGNKSTPDLTSIRRLTVCLDLVIMPIGPLQQLMMLHLMKNII